MQLANELSCPGSLSPDVDAAKTRLTEYQGVSERDKTGGLLEALLGHAPTPQGRSNVAHEIVSCADDLQLRELASRYQGGLLLPMRAKGGQTPPFSEPPSRTSADIRQDSVENLVDAASRELSLMKELALRRDDFRCVINGTADSLACLQRRTMAPPNSTLFTALVHIFPLSLTPRTNQPAEIKKSSTIYEILSHFSGFPDLPALSNDNINRLENSLTLTQDSRTWFGRLDIWLEAVEREEDTYRLQRAHPYAGRIMEGTVIKLSTTDPRLALPYPRLLALHAACARVLHTCGIVEVVDKLIGDMQNMKVLDTEGSEESYEVLRSLLVYWELREW